MACLQPCLPWPEAFCPSGFGRRHICFRPTPYLFSPGTTSVFGRNHLLPMLPVTSRRFSDMGPGLLSMAPMLPIMARRLSAAGGLLLIALRGTGTAGRPFCHKNARRRCWVMWLFSCTFAASSHPRIPCAGGSPALVPAFLSSTPQPSACGPPDRLYRRARSLCGRSPASSPRRPRLCARRRAHSRRPQSPLCARPEAADR